MNLRLSKLTHEFKRNSITAFYNSLKLRPVFLDHQTAVLIKDYFKESRETSSFISEHQNSVQGARDLVQVLQDEKILVSEDVSEKEVINWHGTQLTGNPYVSIMYLILTDRCNLGCRYCFIVKNFEENHKFTDMSTKTAEQSLQTFIRCIKSQPEHFEDEKTIICYGGEPMINQPTLLYVFRRIEELKTNKDLPQSTVISMNTNGTLITKEFAKVLKKHKVALAVSIDGDQWTNDSCRCYRNGKSTFQDVLIGIKNCQEIDVDIGLSCTLNLESVRNFDKTLDMILNKCGVQSLGFNIVLSSDDYPVGADYDLAATEKIIEAFKIFRQKGIQEDRMLRKVETFSKGEVYPFDCGASGGGQLVIAPDGRIGICHGYLAEGKYFSSHVSDSTFNPIINDDFNEWSKRSPLNMERCFNCPALGICGGGCPMYADQFKGSIWELDERFCVHAKTILEWLIWDLYEQHQKNMEA